jgi:hypothetical protein
MARLRRTAPGVSLFAALVLFASGPGYRSASVDESGQLHIVLDSGREILPEKAHGQVSFTDPLISPDRRTVGWLAEYPAPFQNGTLSGKLVIYRAGRVLHAFDTEQVFWDWQFQDGGKRVAYSTGPTHGGAALCLLREVESGRVVAHWRVKSAGKPPSWAESLRQ